MRKNNNKLDETEYLMKSKTNFERIKKALKGKKGKTFKNLKEFKKYFEKRKINK